MTASEAIINIAFIEVSMPLYHGKKRRFMMREQRRLRKVIDAQPGPVKLGM